MYYAAICAIAKDEDLSLKEWVTYHFLIGFDHIIIYDNGSKIPISETLKEYVDENLVTVYDFPTQNAQQLSAYYHCIKTWKDKARWMAFIDIDEFVVPINDNDIRTFLNHYEEYSGVGAHWLMFNSNGHIKHPSGNVIENYTETTGLSNLYKSIAKIKEVIKPLSPHHFQYKTKYAVNDDRICLPNARSYPTASEIQLNHYYYKSQQDYEEKINRGLGTAVKNNGSRNIQMFYDHLNLPHKKDAAILKFVPLLNIFLKRPVAYLAKFVNDQISNHNDQIQKTIDDLGNLIGKGEILEAEQKYKAIAHYVHIPEIYIFGMYIYFFKQDYAKFKDILSQALSEYPDQSLDFYKVFAKFYQNITNKENDGLVDYINELDKNI